MWVGLIIKHCLLDWDKGICKVNRIRDLVSAEIKASQCIVYNELIVYPIFAHKKRFHVCKFTKKTEFKNANI